MVVHDALHPEPLQRFLDAVLRELQVALLDGREVVARVDREARLPLAAAIRPTTHRHRLDFFAPPLDILDRVLVVLLLTSRPSCSYFFSNLFESILKS